MPNRSGVNASYTELQIGQIDKYVEKRNKLDSCTGCMCYKNHRQVEQNMHCSSGTDLFIGHFLHQCPLWCVYFC